MITTWFIANLLTGIAYFHIPYELVQWSKGVKSKGLHYVGYLFTAFIVGCGTHHLVMLRHVYHHPVDVLQVSTDVFMATASVITSLTLIKLRPALVKLWPHIVEEVENG